MLDNFKKFAESKTYYSLVYFYLFFIIVIVVFSSNFGIITSFANISKSMGEVIPLGSVVITKSYPSYEVGDVISYYANINDEETIVTHRITAIGGNVYVTKGDANILEDRDLVRPRLIIGKVVSVIPYLGYFLHFSKTIVGTILFIIGPALLIIFLELTKTIPYLKSRPKLITEN